jgi:hypothetical protein
MIRVASTAASSCCEPLRQLLTAHGIDNHVLNAASLSIDRQARRVKTGRTDVDGLIRALAALVWGECHVCRLVARALDVARFGTDRTVFTLRSGSRVEYVEVQAKKDTMEVAARAKVLSERLNATAVYVDVIGVGVIDKLKLDGVEVVAVNAVEVAPNRSANKDDAQGRIMRDYPGATHETMKVPNPGKILMSVTRFPPGKPSSGSPSDCPQVPLERTKSLHASPLAWNALPSTPASPFHASPLPVNRTPKSLNTTA